MSSADKEYPLNGHGVNYRNQSLILLITETLKRNKSLEEISFVANGEWAAVFKVKYAKEYYILKIELINKTKKYPTASQLDRERNILKRINDTLKSRRIVSYIAEPLNNVPVDPMMIPTEIIEYVRKVKPSKQLGTSYKMNVVVFPFYTQTIKYCFGIDEKLAKRYFKQFLRCITQCHITGYIHRDINDGNFMFQNEKFENIVLIDFGLARPIPTREEKSAEEEGSRQFNSYRVENSETASIRDDLESIAFLAWSMIEPLPWKNGNSKTLKQSLKGCPEWLKRVVLYARSLKLTEQIDMKKVLEMIE